MQSDSGSLDPPPLSGLWWKQAAILVVGNWREILFTDTFVQRALIIKAPRDSISSLLYVLLFIHPKQGRSVCSETGLHIVCHRTPG